MVRFFEILSMIASVVGALWFVFGLVVANGAPQECAAAAEAIAIAVIPYTIAATLQRRLRA